jgi:uncharacterized protein YqeY
MAPSTALEAPVSHESSPLQLRLQEDLKTAMRAREEVRVGTIRLLIADLKNATIEKMGTLTAADELTLLAKHKKQREESIAAFEAGGRTDLVARERAELSVVLGYLPSQLDDAAVRARIAEVIAETGAASRKDMGKLMGRLAGEMKGRFPGDQLKRLVEEALPA